MASVSRSRWITKKLARQAMAAGAWTLGTTPRIRPRLHVLTYHRFGDAVRDPFCVRRQEFVRQMAWLAARQLAISLADLEGFLVGTTAVPDGAALVTIDDGCRSFMTDAMPILRDYGIPSVLYVPAALVGTGTTNGIGEAVLGWDELAELQRYGVVVGSHALHHRSLGRMAPAAAREEAFISRELLSARLGAEVTSFAYPFGTRADYNDTTRTILREAGYRTAFTSRHGAIRSDLDPLELPRVKVEGGDPDWIFPLSCGGTMDAWSVVDRGLWRMQR